MSQSLALFRACTEIHAQKESTDYYFNVECGGGSSLRALSAHPIDSTRPPGRNMNPGIQQMKLAPPVATRSNSGPSGGTSQTGNEEPITD